MESILTSVKKLLGITEDYEHFDTDLIIHINSVFMNLKQLGVGPTNGFRIEDKLATWQDFIPFDDAVQLDAVKTYMYAKVKLVFDPPASSAHTEALKEIIKEYEWRLNVEVETP